MTNAKNCVLASLLLLSFGEFAYAGSSVSGLSQQELNKLGQQEAKGNSAYNNFTVKDDKLKEKACVQGDVISGDDVDDIIEDDTPI